MKTVRNLLKALSLICIPAAASAQTDAVTPVAEADANVILVIDGTTSMKPYFTAAIDGLYEGFKTFSNSADVKIGAVIYRDKTNEYPVEVLPLTSLYSHDFIDFMDNGGVEGVTSSPYDKTLEEELFLGLETALDSEALGYNPLVPTLFLIIGDTGNLKNDESGMIEAIANKMAENNAGIIAIQTRYENSVGHSYDAFRMQLSSIIKKAIDAQCIATGLPAGQLMEESSTRVYDSTSGNTGVVYYPKNIGALDADEFESMIDAAIGMFADKISERKNICRAMFDCPLPVNVVLNGRIFLEPAWCEADPANLDGKTVSVFFDKGMTEEINCIQFSNGCPEQWLRYFSRFPVLGKVDGTENEFRILVKATSDGVDNEIAKNWIESRFGKEALELLAAPEGEVNEIYREWLESRFGNEGAQFITNANKIRLCTGYTTLNASDGTPCWKPMILISDKEIVDILMRLLPAKEVCRNAKDINRADLVAALAGFLKTYYPVFDTDAVDITAMIASTEGSDLWKSTKKITLSDLSNPEIVSDKELREIAEGFINKYQKLANVARYYDCEVKIDGNACYWIPLEDMP